MTTLSLINTPAILDTFLISDENNSPLTKQNLNKDFKSPQKNISNKTTKTAQVGIDSFSTPLRDITHQTNLKLKATVQKFAETLPEPLLLLNSDSRESTSSDESDSEESSCSLASCSTNTTEELSSSGEMSGFNSPTTPLSPRFNGHLSPLTDFFEPILSPLSVATPVTPSVSPVEGVMVPISLEELHLRRQNSPVTLTALSQKSRAFAAARLVQSYASTQETLRPDGVSRNNVFSVPSAENPVEKLAYFKDSPAGAVLEVLVCDIADVLGWELFFAPTKAITLPLKNTASALTQVIQGSVQPTDGVTLAEKLRSNEPLSIKQKQLIQALMIQLILLMFDGHATNILIKKREGDEDDYITFFDNIRSLAHSNDFILYDEHLSATFCSALLMLDGCYTDLEPEELEFMKQMIEHVLNKKGEVEKLIQIASKKVKPGILYPEEVMSAMHTRLNNMQEALNANKVNNLIDLTFAAVPKYEFFLLLDQLIEVIAKDQPLSLDNLQRRMGQVGHEVLGNSLDIVISLGMDPLACYAIFNSACSCEEKLRALKTLYQQRDQEMETTITQIKQPQINAWLKSQPPQSPQQFPIKPPHISTKEVLRSLNPAHPLKEKIKNFGSNRGAILNKCLALAEFDAKDRPEKTLAITALNAFWLKLFNHPKIQIHTAVEAKQLQVQLNVPYVICDWSVSPQTFHYHYQHSEEEFISSELDYLTKPGKVLIKDLILPGMHECYLEDLEHGLEAFSALKPSEVIDVMKSQEADEIAYSKKENGVLKYFHVMKAGDGVVQKPVLFDKVNGNFFDPKSVAQVEA